jgi:hypothetical protein
MYSAIGFFSLVVCFFFLQCTRVLRAAWSIENYELLKAMCSGLRAEMELITRDGIMFDGKKYNITFIGFGDMKFTRIWYGLGAASSTYCCQWCNCTKHELEDSLTNDKWYEHDADADADAGDDADDGGWWVQRGRDWPLTKMRTYEAMKKLWADRGGERKKKKDDADYGNQIAEPLMPFDTALSPLDWLHAVINICRKFEEVHQWMRSKLGMEKAEGDAKYQKHLHDHIGVNRTIQGLTGGECARILKNAVVYISMVKAHKKSGQLLSCMNYFYWLHQHANGRGCTATEWRDRAQLFGKEMVQAFGGLVSGSVYLHAVVNHGWRWIEWTQAAAAVGALGGGGGLLPFSTQGLEAVNRKLRHDKRLLSAAQPHRCRSAQAAMEANLKQLKQVVERHNRESSEFVHVNLPPSSAAAHHCTLCFEQGHNRRTCPLAAAAPAAAPATPAIVEQE